MEIKNFIEAVLNELQDLKSSKSKTNYIVEELEFELGLVISKGKDKKIEVSASVFGIGGGVNQVRNTSMEDLQKVKIKLKPKNQQSKH